MRDIPVFTTQNGVASLTLRQIPYTADAYIRIQDTMDPEPFLKECCDFCRAVGAEHIYATGHHALDSFPLHTTILSMRCLREMLPETDAALFPVQQNTLEQWRDIYNEKMRAVPNARYMTTNDVKELLEKGNGYYIHRGDTLLGIGIASGNTVEAIASVVPGAGRDIMLALNHALSGDVAELTVASENKRAIRLYETLGFVVTDTVESWFKIF